MLAHGPPRWGTGALAWMGTLVADYRDNFSLAMARSSSVNSPFHSGVRSRASTERSSLPCSFRKMNPGVWNGSTLRTAWTPPFLVKTPCPIAEAAPLIVKALQRGFEFFFAGHWATQIDFTTQPAFREVARTGPARRAGSSPRACRPSTGGTRPFQHQNPVLKHRSHRRLPHTRRIGHCRSRRVLFPRSRVEVERAIRKAGFQLHHFGNIPHGRHEHDPQLARDAGAVRQDVVSRGPVRFDPLRMRLQAPPRITHQQRLGPSELPRSRQFAGHVPRRIAPGAPVRRRSKRLLRGVHLPNSVGPVGVSGGPAQYAGPEHEALHFLPALLQDA